MADFPAMPLWTDAYLADTRHLSDAEHGRYLLMLMDMWRSPGCRFPNDRAWLERRFRKTPEEFDLHIQPLLNEFCKCDGNWWTQKKLLKVWQVARRQSQNQSARAKTMWEKRKVASRGNAQSMPAQAMPPSPTPSPKSQSPSCDIEPSTETPAASLPEPAVASIEGRKAGDALGDQPDLDALFYQRGKALLGKKAGGQLTKLRAAVGSVGVALEIIDQAQRKDSPAEYIAGCIRNRGNGALHHGRTSARGSVVEALRRLQESDERREGRSRDDADDGPDPRDRH